MTKKFRALPLRYKIMTLTLIVNLFVFTINLLLSLGVNRMSDKIDTVYQANLQLNELSVALNAVQDDMTEYLNVKTSDSLENYYRSSDSFMMMTAELDEKVTESPLGRMERSIKNMSSMYLDEVAQTIDAKRGRNVEKYRAHYEAATRLYGYLNSYIYSLNNEQFKENTGNYRNMVDSFRTFETIGNLIMAAAIVVNALLILNLTSVLIRPLNQLKDMADEVGKGNFDIEPIPVESLDEIGVVTGAFNQMVEGTQHYIEKLRENAIIEQKHIEKELTMETHLKDAQLKYLQAQINPHFLFNTLNAGAQLAMMEGADRTNEYIRVMAEFFRYNVKKGSEVVTIGAELELIDNYIYILNVRFSGDIQYEKEVDITLLGVHMPSMILQPIVENCVNHGIHEMMGKGRIIMKVYRQDDMACISIEDNGAGMDEETISKLMAGTSVQSKKSSNGVGMDNVMARLKLYEGREDVLKIESEGLDMGSRFTVYLKIRGEEDV